MPPESTELEHRLTKLELLQQNIEHWLQDDRDFREIFRDKIDKKLDDISIKIEGLRFYEKTIEKMEKQVSDHDKKIEKLSTYLKIMAGLFFLSGGSVAASLFKIFTP